MGQRRGPLGCIWARGGVWGVCILRLVIQMMEKLI